METHFKWPRGSRMAKLPEATHDPLGFFEAIKLGDFVGKWIRVSSKQQRQFFGNVPFGRQAICVADNGEVHVFRSVAFGQDWNSTFVYFDQLKKVWRYRDCDISATSLPLNR